ncbi:hypothetical protein AKJ16_DCAP05430 [Drosera capensis]
MKIKLWRLLCCFPTYGHCAADASSQEPPPLLTKAEYDQAEVSSRRRRRKSSVGGFQSAWRPSLCTIKENDVIGMVVVGKGDMKPGSKGKVRNRISYTPSDTGLNRPFGQHMKLSHVWFDYHSWPHCCRPMMEKALVRVQAPMSCVRRLDELWNISTKG